MYICGTKDSRFPTITCENFRLKRELQQSNAVVDAIGTLTENAKAAIRIAHMNDETAMVFVWSVDARRQWSHVSDAGTLREALEQCVKARDEFDKESGR